MHIVKRLLILMICLAGLAIGPQAAAAPSRRHDGNASTFNLQPSTSARLRIGVVANGIVRLTPADLAAAGVDPATVDPRTFALSSLAEPVAIRVTGEADGRFDAGDAVEFFGQRFRGPEMAQKYTDERVYWLDIGGAPGLRIADVDATPQGNLTPPADFPTTVHAEQSNYWYTLHGLGFDTQDTWFWESLQPLAPAQGITRTLPYTVPFPAPGITATLRLEEFARVESPALSPDHRTTIGLNGAALLDRTWDGHVRQVFDVAVPAGLLVSGVNTVTVAALIIPGVGGDWVYANYWELDYRRRFSAWNDRLDFQPERSGLQEFESTDWTSPQVAIWDISNAAQPRRLTGATAISSPPLGTAAGSRFNLRFRADADSTAHYWLQGESTAAGPASLAVRPPTDLRAPAGGADAVIVTPAAFRPAAERLADWHRVHGRRAVIADIQDVYDEFNEGIYHPQAVPAMLAWAQTHWASPPPAFLTLVGDGHWNFKGFNPALYPAGPNPIPPYLAWADPWQGEVPADALYGDLDGDGVPDLAVGRLAVNTLVEAETVVDKLVTYDEGVRAQPWQRRALFVADNPDAESDFPAVSDEIIQGYLPRDLIPQRVYLPGHVPDQPATPEQIATARAVISATLQAGVGLVQYTGHGAIYRWTQEAPFLLATADIAGLTNGARLPVVMTFDCLDGYFAFPGQPSIAELMQRQPGGGSVAAISPSGLGDTVKQLQFRKILMTVIYQDGVAELGRALTIAKQRFYAQFGANYQIATMMLYGDPALRLPAGLAWQYLPTISKTP